ncbi:TM2 domain-containing protein [Arthrobacter caoxuetaonis]|uniref:NINE protein n=1 Tax=Arthrobacter caoxuetaonis TaxID=2886935 RepID=A0A9X1SEA2_9MICC|nr:TM2 domain-containing protein [Arthrobacter caoxuetaonis]MCC3299652.1 NINE protein [Arthrobacter caoxuetaonis]USQ59006.1 NINE protein [Arthrobacter caoxuetaonis]
MSSTEHNPGPAGQPFQPQGYPAGYPATQQQPYPGPGGYPMPPQAPQKSFLVTWLLSLLLGVLGVDRFYLGKVGTGIAKLLTVGGLGVWWLVDLIIVISGKQTDKFRRPLEGYDRHKKLAIIITIVWIVLGAIVNAVNGAGQDVEASPAPAPATSQSQAPAAAETTKAAEPAPEPKKTEEPAPTPEPDPLTPTQTFSGTGDDVITADLAGRPAIVTFTCGDCSNNTVLETNGADSLLVNEIGVYSGKHIVDTRTGSTTTEFVVTAVGNWTLTVEDVTTIPHSDGPVSGTGDDVVVLTSGTKAAISYQGESNFVIQTYGDRNDLAVNTIGAYEGTVKISTPAFIQVTASGPWSITPQ